MLVKWWAYGSLVIILNDLPTCWEREGEGRLKGRGPWTSHWPPWLCLLYWFLSPLPPPIYGQHRGLPPSVCPSENSSTSRASISTSLHMAPNFFLDCNHPSCSHTSQTACEVFSSGRSISSIKFNLGRNILTIFLSNPPNSLLSSRSTGDLSPYFTGVAAIKRELLQVPPPNLLT